MNFYRGFMDKFKIVAVIWLVIITLWLVGLQLSVDARFKSIVQTLQTYNTTIQGIIQEIK